MNHGEILDANSLPWCQNMSKHHTQRITKNSVDNNLQQPAKICSIRYTWNVPETDSCVMDLQIVMAGKMWRDELLALADDFQPRGDE